MRALNPKRFQELLKTTLGDADRVDAVEVIFTAMEDEREIALALERIAENFEHTAGEIEGKPLSPASVPISPVAHKWLVAANMLRQMAKGFGTF